MNLKLINKSVLLVLLLVLSAIIQSCNNSNIYPDVIKGSIKREIKNSKIIDIKRLNNAVFVLTNNEVLSFSINNNTLLIRSKGTYTLPKKSKLSAYNDIGIIHIDETLIVIQMNDSKNKKDTLYFVDSKTCQKISERVLNNYERVIFIKTNSHEQETNEFYYLLAKPGNNANIILEKASYQNQRIVWSYASLYSDWGVRGVMFIDDEKLLLLDDYSDQKHYQINLIGTQDGSILYRTLIEKTIHSNLRLTPVSDQTCFFFDFNEVGVTTSVWDLNPDYSIVNRWTKILDGVKRENIKGFTNEHSYIYFIHQDKLSKGGTLWYFDLLKGQSIPIKMKIIPDEIERTSPKYVTLLDNHLFLSTIRLIDKNHSFIQSIFLIDQADGSILWEKRRAVESYYDGTKMNIFASKKIPFFVSGNTAAFVWNEDKVELINLSDGSSKNFITKRGLYIKYDASFFVQDQDNLFWIRDNGEYDLIKL